jgi:hypothetical protein
MNSIKTQLILSLFLLLNSSVFSQTFNWAKQFGGAGDEHVHAIVTDVSKNVFVTGDFSATCYIGTFTLVPQTVDVYVAKLDPLGNPLWAISFPGNGHADSFDMKIDAMGDVYVCGTFDGSMVAGSTTLTSNGTYNAFVVKISSGGTVVYAKKIGGAGFDVASSLDVDNLGNVYLTGSFEQTVAFGTQILSTTGSSDIFICKLNPIGDILWAVKGGGTLSEYGGSIKLSTNNSLIVSGSFAGLATFGTASLTSSGSRDAFLASFDNLGNFNWAKRYGSSAIGDEQFSSISVDNLGNIFACGSFSDYTTIGSIDLTSRGGKDFFISKLDPSGNPLWAVSNGSAFDDFGTATIDDQKNIYVTGSFNGIIYFNTFTLSATNPSGPDIFILKYDSNGNEIWGKSAGGIGWDAGQALNFNDNNIYVAGSFNASANFGSINLPYMQNNDNIFVTELSTDDPLSIKENSFANFDIAVYPNPVSHFINFSMNEMDFFKSGKLYISVYDMTGKMVQFFKLPESKSQFDFEILPNANYLITVTNVSNEILFSKKIIKQ